MVPLHDAQTGHFNKPVVTDVYYHSFSKCEVCIHAWVCVCIYGGYLTFTSFMFNLSINIY
jgi:hypothetical protein